MGASEGTYEKVLELLGDIKGKKILDCGCGKGRFSEIMSEKGAKIYCCDMDEEQFLAKNIPFKSGDLNKKIPYSSSFFDRIVSIEVVEHLENPHNFIREIKRILKFGGEAIITTPNIENIKSRLQFFFKGDFHWFHKSEFGKKGSRHINPIYFKEIEYGINREGLKIVRLDTNRHNGYTFYIDQKSGALKKYVYNFINLIFDLFYNAISVFAYAEKKILKTADIVVIKIKKE